MTGADLEWPAPGPGDWWLVKEHFPAPVSRMLSDLFPAATIGWTRGAARYGLATGVATWGVVNGWIYAGPQIPPTADELAEREVAAVATLASTPWRDEVVRWHEEERPAVVAANRALQAVDVALLDDVDLAEHLHRVARHFLAVAPLHFEHTGFDLAAGHLFEAVAAWGLDVATVPALLAGASPGSAEVDAHLRHLAAELDAAGAPAPVTDLDEIRAASPGAAGALQHYLADYGFRPIGGRHFLEPTLAERPEVIVASVNARRARGADDGGVDRRATEARDAFRAAVPAADRERFDALLDDARASYGLRDDDVGVCWNWPLGLLRIAAREAGRRLAEDREVLAEADHILEATVDEAADLLTGADDALMGAVLAERWALRVRAEVADPPAHLEGPPLGGRDEPALPPNVARLSALRDAVWRVAPPAPTAPLHGVGIGAEVVTGPARLVRHPDDLFLLGEGDVLVTVATTAAFNAVFPLLAGVVTEAGGLFSHTAILAREVGLPAVVGVAGALDAIADGDTVEVDPVAGAVRVVRRAAAEGAVAPPS